MEKQSNPQMELFAQASDSSHLKVNSGNGIIERIWAHEKTVLIIIAFLVTGIIAFSAGVEKGKRNILNEQSKQLVLVKPQNTAPAPAVIVRKEEALTQVVPLTAQKQGAFTIQVASFKTKANAQKEAENIKKRGLSAILLNKGSYVILCVGNFPNKETAQPLLSELSRRYGSCQIRRL